MLARSTHPLRSGDSAAPPLHPVAAAHHDPAVACGCDVHTETGPAGEIVVLRVAGEIDLLTLPLVQTALTAAMGQVPDALVVDLAAMRFCCVRGLHVLTDTAHTATTSGISYALSGLHPHLDRIATMLWPDHGVVRYRSAAAAVTAIRIEQTYRLT